MAALKGSMGGVTLERSKLDRRQKVQTQEPKLSNDGGGGGIGNKIFNGGGGDGDDGDDDDYFNFDGGDGDGDESFWRTAVCFCHSNLALCMQSTGLYQYLGSQLCGLLSFTAPFKAKWIMYRV